MLHVNPSMDPLVIELKRILARVKRIERAITTDPGLCQMVKDCHTQIENQLNQRKLNWTI